MAKPPKDLKGIAALLASQGRGGDTMLAHINPQEAELLKALGGSGTTNPNTGLPEYGWFSDFVSNPLGTVTDTLGITNNSSGGGGGGGGFLGLGKLYDATIGQVVGPNSVTGKAVEAVRGITGGAAETVRGITGGAADAVQSVASKLGTTVEAIASDPKKLAAVGLMVAFPGAAGAVGEFLMGEVGTALGVEGAAFTGATSTGLATVAGEGTASAAAKIIGQTAINTALNGGNFEQAVKAAMVQQGIPAALSSETMQSLNKDMTDLFGKYGAQATTQAGLAAIMGKDPVAAFVFSGATSAAGLITKEIPGFSDMPPSAQKAINATVLAKLTGKDAATAAANSLVASATQTAKHGFAVQDAVMKSNGTVLNEKQLSETENITPQQAVKVSDISQKYGRDFSDLASAMEKQDEIPDAVKAKADTYQAVFKKVGDNLYTFAGGENQYGPNWVLDDKGEVARVNGEMILYDDNKDTIQTSSGSITVDPKTGDDIRKTYSKAAGFGDDFQSWIDAKAVGIDDPKEWNQYENIDALYKDVFGKEADPDTIKGYMPHQAKLSDTLDALKVYLGKKDASPQDLERLDFDGDGTVELSDVLNLQKYYLGKKTTEEPSDYWTANKTQDDLLSSMQHSFAQDKGFKSYSDFENARELSLENNPTDYYNRTTQTVDTITGGQDTSSGGQDTSTGGQDTAVGGQDTLSGGQDSVTGGEATTQGGAGTDTTTGGQDTQTGGQDTLGGGDSIGGGTQPNIEYHADGSYTITYEDGTSTHLNADGTPYSTVDNTGTTTITVFADDTSPSGYRNSLGDPVNQDGSVYAPTHTGDTLIGGGGQDTTSGGTSTVTGGTSTQTGGGSTQTGGQSTQTGGQSTQTGGQSTQTGGQSTQAGGQDTAAGGSNANALLALLGLFGSGGQQQNPTPPPVADIKYYYDFGDPFNPKRGEKDKPEQFDFFDGGEVNSFSVDDLIEMLKKD